GRHRWKMSYERVRLEQTDGKQLVKEDGVYLITGGVGGIGLAIAEFLARTARVKLILVGRSSLPDREEWEEWIITHDEQDELSTRLRKIRAIEELGAEVLPLSADVTDLEQMHRVVALSRQRFGQVNGVIHAAGIPGGGIIQLKALEDSALVLAPKVQGTRVI